MGFTNIGFADLSFKSQTYSFDLNENSANGTVIGQVTATGGDYAYTLQLLTTGCRHSGNKQLEYPE